MPRRRRRRVAPKPAPKAPIVEKISRELRAEVYDIFAPRTKLSADVVDPARISERLSAIVEKHLALPAPVKADLSRVSDETFEHVVIVEKAFSPEAVREMQRWTKEHWAWSAADMANYLGCKRPQLKRIEKGTRKPSEEFIVRFRHLRELRAGWLKERGARDRDTIIVESDKPLPRRWRVLRRIVHCSAQWTKTQRCPVWFERINGRHRLCHTNECDERRRKRKRRVK